MHSINTYSNKQSILDRMLDFAAKYQGTSKSELLDPVIVLFIESLAEEVYKLSGEIDNLESRVLDKLSSMLVSDIEAIAHPAYSILHAVPLESKLAITKETEFVCRQDSNRKKQNLSLYPVCNLSISKGAIRYFVYDRYFYSVDTDLTKTLLTRSGRSTNTQEKSLWIGLELDDSINSLRDLSFYFNSPGGYAKDEFLKQLSHTSWKLHGADIPKVQGLTTTPDLNENKSIDIFSACDNSNRINQRLKSAYDKHFVSIEKELDISNKREKFPFALQENFSANFQQDFTKDIVWIEVVCPPNFTDEMIRSIEISINAFPVVCKQLVKQILELNQYMPVIPLNTQVRESFLSVHSLSDSSGLKYYDIPLSNTQNSSYGIYSVRRGGYERFGSNEAKEFLVNMTKQIEGEAASFFRDSKEAKAEQALIQSEVNKMIRDLNKVTLDNKGHSEIKNYLIIEQEKQSEIYFLDYWVTKHIQGNTIKMGTVVQPSEGLQIESSSAMLLQHLAVGKQTPSQTEKYSLYKKTLAEHTLLVTDEDIEQFCLKEFSDMVDKVKIRQGYEQNKDPKIGFLRTTDVHITMHKHQDKENKNNIEYFKKALEEHSPATFKYRIIIK